MPKFTLYHESNHEFAQPNLDAMRLNTTSHANGGLGLWTSVSDGPPRGEGMFGKHLYQVNVTCAENEVRILPLHELAQLNYETEFTREMYETWREQLIEQGYKLAVVVEVDHKVKQAIILDFSIITAFFKKERQP